MKTVNIAIDGPAGAGKSSLAKKLASRLGFTYIDTGALYRSVAYEVVTKGLSPNDLEKIKDILSDTDISFQHINGTQRVFVNGEDVSDRIRTNEISSAASTVSAAGPEASCAHCCASLPQERSQVSLPVLVSPPSSKVRPLPRSWLWVLSTPVS